MWVPLNDEVNGISSKIMFVMQKEEVKFKTPDITLKDVGINPFFDRARTKAARKTKNASLVHKPFVNQTCILSVPCGLRSSWNRTRNRIRTNWKLDFQK